MYKTFPCLFLLLQNGTAQELDLATSDSEDEDEPSKKAKSKLSGKLSKSEESDSEEDSEEDSDDERITAANFEAKARALDERALLDAELDAEELRQAALAHDSDDEMMDDDVDMDEAGEGDGDGLVLPTAEEREEERKTGAQDLNMVHRRMKHCARVLSNFKRLGSKDRSVAHFSYYRLYLLIVNQVTVRIC